jgi:hypothetical protein
VLKNIKNIENKANTQKSKPTLRPKGKNRELRNLEAELGVERYKNSLISGEIQENKRLLSQNCNYLLRFNSLQSDFSHLQLSVQRSKLLQSKQQEEIESLKKKLSQLKKN